MVYKGDYGPAELLCPRTYKWVKLDEDIRKKISSHLADPSLVGEHVEVDPRMAHTLDKKKLEAFVENNTRT